MSGEQQREPFETAEVTAQRLGNLVRGALPDGFVFGLVIARVGAEPSFAWISSVARAQQVDLLRQLANNLEGRA